MRRSAPGDLAFVTALERHPDNRDFIGQWMSLIAPVAARLGPRGHRPHAEYLEQMEKASIANSLENLMTFPRLRGRVEAGELALHGAYFGVATGQLSVRDPVTGKFSAV